MNAYSLCGTSVDNTGEQACDKAKGVIKQIFVDNGTVEQADYGTPLAFFNELVRKSKLSKSDSQKIFPFPEVQDVADASEANKEGSLNQGFKTVLLEGKPAYKIKFFGGADLLKRLKTFDNQTVRMRELDANGIFWGTKSGTDSIGYQVKLFTTGGKVATGQNVEEGVIETTVSILNTSEYFKSSYWADLDGNNSGDIVPLIDVNLTNISHVTNVWKIGMYINGSNNIGAYNIYDAQGAAIAALSAQFSAGTGTNYGTPLTITSIAVDASLKCLTVTFDSTAYTALAPGTVIKLSPPTPTQLDAGNVNETELLYILLTK